MLYNILFRPKLIFLVYFAFNPSAPDGLKMYPLSKAVISERLIIVLMSTPFLTTNNNSQLCQPERCSFINYYFMAIWRKKEM